MFLSGLFQVYYINIFCQMGCLVSKNPPKKEDEAPQSGQYFSKGNTGITPYSQKKLIEPPLANEYAAQVYIADEVIRMSCQHIITKQKLIEYLNDLINHEQYTIKCPFQLNGRKNCDQQWNLLDDLQPFLSTEEFIYFGKKFSETYLSNMNNITKAINNSSKPIKRNYYQQRPFKFQGIKILIKYNSGSAKQIIVSTDMSIFLIKICVYEFVTKDLKVDEMGLFLKEMQLENNRQLSFYTDSSQDSLTLTQTKSIKKKQFYKTIQNSLNGNPEIMREIINLAADTNISIDFNKSKIIMHSYNEKDLQLLQKTINMLYVSARKSINVAYPKEWSSQKSDIEIVQVPKTSSEFTKIQQAFKVRPIKKLERVQNKILYKKYFEEKQFLMELQKGISLKTMMLYHGSRSAKPSEIYGDKQQSFNINYSSQNNLLGKGIYFAEQAAYSVNYAHNSTDGYQQMFYCEVIVGDSEKTNPNNNQIKDTSFKNVNQRIKYQSRTAFLNGSNVYVVYKSRRAYPAYLISF